MRALALLAAAFAAACAQKPAAPAATIVYLPCPTSPIAAPVPPAVHAERAFERANRSVLDINSQPGVPSDSLQKVQQLHERAAHARDVAVTHPRSPKAAAQAMLAASALDHFIEIVKRRAKK